MVGHERDYGSYEEANELKADENGTSAGAHVGGEGQQRD
jgi:hypothetical protein